MNRAQRRKASTEELISAHRRSIEHVVERNRMEAIKQSCELITACVASALHTDFNFGAARINKVILGARRHIELIESGVVDIPDVLAWCKDYGVEL